MKNITLTDLEKKVLRDCLSEGYAFDCGNETFLCYGISGKQERGAAASLVKKGVLSIFEEDDDVYVSCGSGYVISDIIEISEYKR